MMNATTNDAPGQVDAFAVHLAPPADGVNVALALSSARERAARAQQELDQWQTKLQSLEAQALQVEAAAGEAVLQGGDMAEAGAKIAAARSAIAAAKLSLQAAHTARERAQGELELATAAETREQARRKIEMGDRQCEEIRVLCEEMARRDGVLFVRWRKLGDPDLPGLLDHANMLENSARRRLARAR